MRPSPLLVLAALSLAAPAFAAGDPAMGESEFKKCKSCHAIIAGDGTEIIKGGKTGPNLYGVVGRAAGSTDFAYSDALKAAGAAGLIWDEAALVTYLADPTAFLRDKTGDAAARSKMAFKLAKGAEDIVAYLASVAP
jgi:cytochrome c